MNVSTKENIFGKDNRTFWMGLAIISIILFHIHYWYPNSDLYSYLTSKGYLGVDVFFLLSAYGLSASCEKNSIVVFYRNRITRLFPMFLYAIVSFAFLYSNGNFSEIFKMVLEYCTGIAILQERTFFWYIPATILLYALFPIVFPIVKKLNGKNKFFDYILIILCIIVANHSFGINRMFLIRFPIIMIGILSYLQSENKMLRLYLFSACIGVLLNNESDLSLSLTIPLLLASVNFGIVRMPMKKSISFVGRHSLEIYLAQFLVIEQCYVPIYVHSSLLIKTLLAIPITVIYSTVLYYLHKYSLQILTKFLGRIS